MDDRAGMGDATPFDTPADVAGGARPDAGPDVSARTLESAIGYRVGRAHRRIRSGWESRIADLGLTGPQAAVLRAVAERPGTGLRELARRLYADPMNVKRLADVLERDGLLASASDPDDRRRRVLSPTRTGASIGRLLVDRSAEWSALLERALGADGVATLNRLLDRLEAGVAGDASTAEQDVAEPEMEVRA